MNSQLLTIVAMGIIGRLDSRVEASTPERIDRWKNAVNKASQNLAEGGFRLYNGALAIHSKESNEVYIATRDTCQCEAFTSGLKQPCWHRAAHTIVTKYNQVEGILSAK